MACQEGGIEQREPRHRPEGQDRHHLHPDEEGRANDRCQNLRVKARALRANRSEQRERDQNACPGRVQRYRQKNHISRQPVLPAKHHRNVEKR